MPGTADTEFTIGDQYWCVDPWLAEPLLGTIVALTGTPGKLIGLQFDEDVPGNLSCEGAGIPGRCLWVIPEIIYNPTEWIAVQEDLTAQAVSRHAIRGTRYNAIKIDNDGQIIVGESTLKPLAADEEYIDDSVVQSAAFEDDVPRMPAVKE